MKHTFYDVIVVGAGFAGLSASYHLKRLGLNHVVFERGRTGESWRSQRWDSFRLNSVNRISQLEGHDNNISPEEFLTTGSFVGSFEDYVSKFDLPLVENSKVISIEKPADLFEVTVSANDTVKHYLCRQVIVASGNDNEILVPSFSKNITSNVRQLHTSEYRNAEQLPPGAALVVGGAQSGVQIAEDLVDTGKKVYLSTSMIARVPRWYRGRDIMIWLLDMKFFDMRADDIKDPVMLKLKPPQLTGTGGSKHSISLQALAKKGVVILGKTSNAEEKNIFFQPNAAMHIKFADGFSMRIKEMIDGFIAQTKMVAEAAVTDEADVPDPDASCASSITSLSFEKDNINSIIWATGFKNDLSYIKLPVFDEEGKLKHKEGLSPVPGLYFIGVPWLRSRKSAILYGFKEDAKFIVDKVYEYSKENSGEIPMGI